jgi:hypothetical protein
VDLYAVFDSFMVSDSVGFYYYTNVQQQLILDSFNGIDSTAIYSCSIFNLAPPNILSFSLPFGDCFPL